MLVAAAARADSCDTWCVLSCGPVAAAAPVKRMLRPPCSVTVNELSHGHTCTRQSFSVPKPRMRSKPSSGATVRSRALWKSTDSPSAPTPIIDSLAALSWCVRRTSLPNAAVARPNTPSVGTKPARWMNLELMKSMVAPVSTMASALTPLMVRLTTSREWLARTGWSGCSWILPKNGPSGCGVLHAAGTLGARSAAAPLMIPGPAAAPPPLAKARVG